METQSHRREFVRYQPITWGALGSIADGHTRHRAEILDESLAGAGLRLASQLGLSVGQTVTLDNGRLARKAKLVYVDDDQNGGIRAGLQWTPDSDYRYA